MLTESANGVPGKKQIVVIIGRSGSGKTSIAKFLSKTYNCDSLGFSYAGKYIATMKVDSQELKEIDEYILVCIESSVNRSGLVIVEGLASINVLLNLRKDSYNVCIIYIDTEKDERIHRIAKRENCSIERAVLIEYDKDQGKKAIGIDDVIRLADYRINGNMTFSKVKQDVMQVFSEVLINS